MLWRTLLLLPELFACQAGSRRRLLLLAIQQVGSNVITPVVQERMVSIPPALLLFAVLALGLLFGPLGLVVAVPLTVALFVAVKKLYVRQTLGEPTPVPGKP